VQQQHHLSLPSHSCLRLPLKPLLRHRAMRLAGGIQVPRILLARHHRSDLQIQIKFRILPTLQCQIRCPTHCSPEDSDTMIRSSHLCKQYIDYPLRNRSRQMDTLVPNLRLLQIGRHLQQLKLYVFCHESAERTTREKLVDLFPILDCSLFLSYLSSIA